MLQPMGILAQRRGVMYRPEKTIELRCRAHDRGGSRFAGFFDDRASQLGRFFAVGKYLPTATFADVALVCC